jgi:hypothetical protein
VPLPSTHPCLVEIKSSSSCKSLRAEKSSKSRWLQVVVVESVSKLPPSTAGGQRLVCTARVLQVISLMQVAPTVSTHVRALLYDPYSNPELLFGRRVVNRVTARTKRQRRKWQRPIAWKHFVGWDRRRPQRRLSKLVRASKQLWDQQ